MSSPETPPGAASALSATASVRRTLQAGRRLYAAPRGQSRVRRATDVVALGTSLVALAALILAQPPGSFERALLRFLDAFPTWLRPIWAFLIGLLALWLVLMLVAPLVSRRPRITLEAVLAIVLSALVGLLSARLANGHWPATEATSGVSESLSFPAIRLATAAAVICVVNAHVARPFGSTGRWLLTLGAAAAVLDGRTTIGGTAAAIAIGVAAGAAVRLALGTSAGQPSLEDVAAALDALGVVATGLEPAERQVAGVFLVYGRDPAGSVLSIKVYGRDAYDNQLLAKLWRTLWYRDGAPSGGLARARPAEREALLTLLARNAGAPTSEVVTAGATANGDSMLVLRISGRLLSALAPEEVDDELLARLWAALELLGRAHLAHRQISPSSLRVAADAVTIVDLGGGTVAPGKDGHAIDRAQLLATTAAVAGTARARAAAVAAIGTDGIAALLPYLQQAAFGGSLRRSIKVAEVDIDELREEAAKDANATMPDLVKLRRVTWGTLLQVGLLMLAGAAVLSFVGGVDFGELRQDLRGASWGWIAAAIIVSQLPRITQAISTLGAIPVKVPFGPVYILQLATSYMNLALPSSIARMAVSVRFFQRQGVAPAVAITSGMIDSFANTIVQAFLLVLLLIFSSATITLDFSAPSSSAITHLLLVLVGLVVVVIIAAVFLPIGKRMQAALRERAAQWWPEVRDTIGSLRGSHKLAQVFLANVATEVLFATALGMFARGLGFPISIADLLVINISVALLSTFIPVPGGIGVVEGGLLVGLTAVGMPESTAFAAILLSRITTFYLPPIWGWFALTWLRRNRYL